MSAASYAADTLRWRDALPHDEIRQPPLRCRPRQIYDVARRWLPLLHEELPTRHAGSLLLTLRPPARRPGDATPPFSPDMFAAPVEYGTLFILAEGYIREVYFPASVFQIMIWLMRCCCLSTLMF